MKVTACIVSVVLAALVVFRPTVPNGFEHRQNGESATPSPGVAVEQTQPIETVVLPAPVITLTEFGDPPQELTELTPVLVCFDRTIVRTFESAPKFGNNRNDTDRFKPPHSQLPSQVAFYGRPNLNMVLEAEEDLTRYGFHWMWFNQMRYLTINGFVYQVRNPELQDYHGVTNGDKFQPHEILVSALPRHDELHLKSPDDTVGFLKRVAKSTTPLQLNDNNRLWDVTQFQLISILKHDPPRVYANREFMNGQRPRGFGEWSVDRDELPTRVMDDFERQGLDLLQAGTDQVLSWNQNNGRIQMLGSIRAKSECTECHVVDEGTLLGAFTYWISEMNANKNE